jgi:uncharacterized SAM-binding protein YcdF (DUF218 family)
MTARPPRRRRTFLIGVLCVVIAAAVAAGPLLVVRRPVAAPDAIISLASHEWERLPTAARLAAAAPEALVLLTRPPHPNIFNCHDCDHRVDRLHYYGVAESRVRTIQLTENGTYGEALAVLAFAREHGTRRVMIVTSPYHTRRSLAVFQKVFEGTAVEIGIEPALADSGARPWRWWSRLDDFAYVPYEWSALVYYTWMHGVWRVWD